MNAILSAISNVMGQVGSVKKDGTNSFHNYKYATAADVLHKLQPLLAKEGVIVFQNEQSRQFLEEGSILSVTYEFTIAHKSGELWPEKIVRTGMAPARNSKGGFDDKALNKCHTSAHKYFHITLFEIPTGDYDDADADEDKPAKPANAAQRKEPPPAPEPSKNPATGDHTPHVIPYSDNPMEWAPVYAASLKTSQVLTDIAEWEHYNKATLKTLETSAPTLWKRIKATRDAMQDKLTAPAEAAE